ncbi:Pseudo ankyrin repeat-like [Cedratvirus A11]|uniref:Pseudo ankyrin repeat-like n=1 Tax=Cedratvirus A11 TaxID=1903266 RepID=A0A1M7XVC9_9VIRU|nr:Pseudo ankyrin repeat-like [Cedratvirus A11]SHO33639.1 Pseudo ankyrin repeat-like [Cedratvirus A11]
MSFFELLPNETLEYIFSYIPLSYFPLRQTCKLFRDNIPIVTSEEFRDQVYEAGDRALAEHYNLPCSPDNFQTILRKGHEELFKRQEDKIYFGYGHFTQACVQGKNEYIINYLLNKGYTTRSALFYEACAQNHLELAKRMYGDETMLYACTQKAVDGDALDVLDWIVAKDEIYYTVALYRATYHHKPKVLRWLSRERLKEIPARDMFLSACSAPNMDMFNFLLEIDYIPEQEPEVSTFLAKSVHTQMMRTLVLERGWTLTEEMFSAALEQEMLSCLLELGCPHASM